MKAINENKAIVTDVAGTTRDIVEGQAVIDGILLNFIDTAGIRKTDDKVEQIGVTKSLNELSNANLIILVLNIALYKNLDYRRLVLEYPWLLLLHHQFLLLVLNLLCSLLL